MRRSTEVEGTERVEEEADDVAGWMMGYFDRRAAVGDSFGVGGWGWLGKWGKVMWVGWVRHQDHLYTSSASEQHWALLEPQIAHPRP